MKKWWTGWWNTSKTGLAFEKQNDLKSLIQQLQNYEIKNDYEIYYLNKKVWEIFKKHWLYAKFLEPKGIKFKDYISSKLLPDTSIYVIIKETLFIIEIKNQWSSWSTDEKLQTSDFKRKQYQRLVSSLGINVEFCFILNEWYKQPKYNDVLNYITSMGDKYFWGSLPLDYNPLFEYLWLPKSKYKK